jgi:hypothetical protein
MNNKIRMLFVLSGMLAVGLIFWAALAYLMDLPSFPLAMPLCIAGIVLFLVTGSMKNLEEKRRFREFLESRKRDPEVQENLRSEKVEAGDKTGRAGVKARYRERNTGLNWTGASVHGAVPQRKKRRGFLSKNM